MIHRFFSPINQPYRYRVGYFWNGQSVRLKKGEVVDLFLLLIKTQINERVSGVAWLNPEELRGNRRLSVTDDLDLVIKEGLRSWVGSWSHQS